MPTAIKTRARLGDLLMASGAVTSEQLAQALEVQKAGSEPRLLGEIIVELGYASHEQVLMAVAEAFAVPFARLTPQLVDPAVRGALPDAFIQKHAVLPLFRTRDMLTVAVSEPSNTSLVDDIAHASGLNVQVVAATAENIYKIFDETRPEDAEGSTGQAESSGELPLAGELLMPSDYDLVYSSWPPDKLASLLVREAVRSRASAIHLEPDEKVLRVRFRVDGVLHIVMRPPVRLAAGLAGAFDEMMGLAGKPAAGQDVRRSARVLLPGRAVQIHVASLPSAFGVRTVVRIVRDDEAQKPLENLGCDFELLAAYRALLEDTRGLILVAGPRGGGATTTLYSTVSALDPVRLNVCTLESGTNFHMTGINQFSFGAFGTTDAAAVLSQLLRQQPDVLALDGVPLAQTAEMAVEAALDGCLVLAQVRAADAAEAIAAVAAHAPRRALADVLRGVLSQRLVRTVCLHCRGPGDPPASLRRSIAEKFGPIEQYTKGRGCNSCSRTGFLGQIGLFELAPADGEIRKLICEEAPVEAIRAAIRAAGHPSQWVDGMNKVRAGITSIEEVMEVMSGCPGGVDTVDVVARRP